MFNVTGMSSAIDQSQKKEQEEADEVEEKVKCSITIIFSLPIKRYSI